MCARAGLNVLEKRYFAKTEFPTPDCLARSLVTILTGLYRTSSSTKVGTVKPTQAHTIRQGGKLYQHPICNSTVCPKGYTLGGKERRITKLTKQPPPACQDTDAELHKWKTESTFDTPSLDANSSSSNKEIPHILQNPRSSLPSSCLHRASMIIKHFVIQLMHNI